MAGDLLGAIRGLLRSRTVVILALANLALGIGTSAAMLGLLDVLIFRSPAHVEEAGTLRRIYLTDTFPGMGDFTASETSYPVLQDLERVPSFSALGAFFSTKASLGRGAEARKVRAVLATPGFLRMLGVKPELGRLFADSEDQAGHQSFVALLGYDLWNWGFGRSADVLGRQAKVGSDSYTIVGVLPRGFTGVDLEAADLWLPMNAADRFAGPGWATERGILFLEIVGRLRPKTTPETAAREATAVLRNAVAEAGEARPAARVSLGPIQRARGPEAPAAVKVTAWLSGISWIVLLISCANVASLLLLRGLDRRRELAMRVALGAQRGRLARLLLFEGVVLAPLGTVAALGVFVLMSTLLQRLVLPEAAVRIGELNLRTAAIVAALAAAAGLFSGAVPALWASRDLTASIRGGARESLPGRSRWTATLAAGQIALTFVLLMGAGEFARSLSNGLHLDLGIDADQVLVATVDLTTVEYSHSQVDEIFHQTQERVRRLPGVRGASLAATVPFESSMADSLSVPGVERLPRISTGGPYINAISEDFFATTGTPVLRGRPFTSQDRAGAALVAIVNQTMARLLWPGGDALGRCLEVGGKKATCSTVVGVVKDARRSELQEAPTMQYYIPLDQARKLTARALFVRAAGDPARLLSPVRREFQAVEPNLPFVEVRTLADLLAPQIHPWRMGAAVLTLFGLLALLLAIAGLYGVIAHSLARRTYEMGVRLALGAQWRDLRWLAIRQGLWIGLAGAAVGLLLTLSTTHFVQPLLFHVSASDPLLLTAAAAIVLLVALLASYAPSRRVRRLNPTVALRVE
jgi:putative ABC transport system permease protein